MGAHPEPSGERPQIHHHRRTASCPGGCLVVHRDAVLVVEVRCPGSAWHIGRTVNLHSPEVNDAAIIIVHREAQVAGRVHRRGHPEGGAGVHGDIAAQHVAQNRRIVAISIAEAACSGGPAGIQGSVGHRGPVRRWGGGSLAVVPSIAAIHQRRGRELGGGPRRRDQGQKTEEEGGA